MDSKTTKDTRLCNIEAIRCFAIISLVVWHSLCVYIGWQSSLPDIELAVGGTLLTKIYRIVTTVFIMPDANMPLFVIVAAFVYAYLWEKGAYRDTKVFFKKKINRLVIPYFVIGTIVVLTISDWPPLSMLKGDAHHLWFCAMLFWCFAFIRLYQAFPWQLGFLFLVVCLVLQFVPLRFDVLGIVKGLRYFPYFLFGYYIYIYMPRFKELRWNKLIAVLIWLLSLLIYYYTKRVELVCYAYCFMIFVIVPEDIYIPNWVKIISSYSFGIYVFHEWFLWNAAHLQVLHPVIINHQVLYPVLAFIFALTISIILTHFSLKTRIGRFLLA